MEEILKERFADIKANYNLQDFAIKPYVMQLIDNCIEEAYNMALPQWVSVTERLPETDLDVLVVIERERIRDVVKDKFVTTDEHGNGKNWFHYYFVTHWMPLPTPPNPKD